VRAKLLISLALAGALFASSSARAQTALTADFTIEKPTPCVDGACVVVVKALGTGSGTRSGDSSINLRDDLVYVWDFGNPNNPAPNWIYGSRPGTSKNIHCCGHWFAHFYEGNTGTVTITLKISDLKNGVVATTTKTIQVVPQNTQWPGTSTICVNRAGDSNFAGCPSGATQVNIGATGYADWDDAVRSTMSTPNRILFKCGGTYAANSSLGISVPAGPKLVGGYGPSGVGSASCNGTSDAGTFVVNNTTGGHSPMLSGQTLRNVTFRDMTMDGPGWRNGAGSGIEMIGNPYMDLVLYHDRWRDTAIMQFFENGSQLAANQGRAWIVENDNIDNATQTAGCYPGIPNQTHGGGYAQGDCAWGTQLSCSNCGILGTHYGQIGSHSLRSSKGFYRTIAYSTMDGTTTSDPKAYMKWNAAHANCGGSGNDSCWPDCKDHDSYIGWNFLDERANPHPPVAGQSHAPFYWIDFTPQTAGDTSTGYGTEELTQGIIEGNYMDATNSGAGGGRECISLVSNATLVRNNVCNYSNNDNGGAFVKSDGHGAGSRYPAGATCFPPNVGQNIKILNNTAYSSRNPLTQSIQMRIDPNHVNLRVQNNVVYGPAFNGFSLVQVGAGTNVIADHNLKLSGGAAPFVGAGNYNSMQSFRLVGSDTTARGMGIGVTSARPDADMMCRAASGAPDVGAFDSRAVDCGAGVQAPAALEPPILIQPSP
jgi:hypothetical protein